MKKILLTLAAAALVVGTATAQVVPAWLQSDKPKFAESLMPKKQLQKRTLKLENTVPLSMDLRQSRVDDAQRSHKLLSYLIDGTEMEKIFTGGPLATYTQLKNKGYSGYGFFQAYNPDMLSRYVGNTISKINFAVYNGTVSDVIAIIIDGSTGEALWEAEIPDVKLSSSDGIQLNTVDCDYQITGNEGNLMIGWVAFSASAASDDPSPATAGPVMIMHEDKTGSGNGALLVGAKSNGQMSILMQPNPWLDDENKEMYMSSYIVIETAGNNGIKDNDAVLSSVAQVRADMNSAHPKASAYVQNLGLDAIQSIDYTSELDGVKKEGTYTFAQPLVFYNAAEIRLEAVLPAEAGKGEGTFTITKVNKATDEYTANQDNVAPYTVIAFDGGFLRIPVVEEFTATGCVYCPRGLVGLDNLKAERGDDVVLISVHTNGYDGNDPLATSNYEAVVQAYASGFPFSVVNREYGADPYFDLSNAAKVVAQTPCEAGLTLKAGTMNNLTKKVKATTEVEFKFPVNAGDYAVLYVLTEDNVTGVRQANGYYGMSGLPDDLAFLGTVGQYYEPDFNFVACAISDVAGSSASSQLPAAAAGEMITHTGEIALESRGTGAPAVDKSNVYLSALLIDRNSGIIVTGRQVKLGETSLPSAIDEVENADFAEVAVADGAFNVKAENAKAEVYSVDGKLVSSCTVNGEASLPTFGKGVYVLRVEAAGKVMTKKATF